MSAKESQRLFPTLSQQRKDDHRSLKGTIVYYGERASCDVRSCDRAAA